MKINSKERCWQILGFTNIPFYGKVNKCKECERWSGMKAWRMSKMKQTLLKNKKDL